jgi:glucose-6-phosphate isomerase
LQDSERCKLLQVEFDGVLLDYSRQRVTQDTMILLEKLANAAKIKDKIHDMVAGKHINITEDRAVMHMALRAPRDAVRAQLTDDPACCDGAAGPLLRC